MNQYLLVIKASNQPTVMERLMQVTRYRGFSISDLHMTLASSEDLHIEMTVSSVNPVENLSRQLQKLVDIHSIEVSSSALMQTINS